MNQFDIKGLCVLEFIKVCDVFECNFVLCNEVGVVVVVWVDGDFVVNLWGGFVDVGGIWFWQYDMLVIVLFGIKVLMVMCVYQFVDCGEFDLYVLVVCYWFEFGQVGKQVIMLVMVMSYCFGVIGLCGWLGWEQVVDWDFVCE